MKKIIMMILILIPLNINALTTTAKKAILMDADSGRILYSKKIDEKSLIASTTKIMTSIIAIESGKIDEKVIVGDEILSMYGSNIYLSLNEEITLKDLVYGLLLRSGNDASVTIAKNVGNTIEDFVILMNNKAKELNMDNTYFCNPNGLDEKCENISTARDMGLLMSYCIKNKTFMEITSTKRYIAKSNLKTYDWYNKNKLLSTYEYTTGGKTGFTDKAGRTLVTSASKDNMNLVAVTLNDPNDFTTHKQLYEYGFNNYKMYLILDKNDFNVRNKYYDNIYIDSSFYYPLKSDEIDKLTIKYLFNKDENRENDVVGVATVYLDNVKIKEIDIKKGRNKKKESIFKRILKLFK